MMFNPNNILKWIRNKKGKTLKSVKIKITLKIFLKPKAKNLTKTPTQIKINKILIQIQMKFQRKKIPT